MHTHKKLTTMSNSLRVESYSKYLKIIHIHIYIHTCKHTHICISNTHAHEKLTTMAHSLHVEFYRLAKTHRMPYLYRSFPQKNPIIRGSFAKNDLQLKAFYPCKSSSTQDMGWLRSVGSIKI